MNTLKTRYDSIGVSGYDFLSILQTQIFGKVWHFYATKITSFGHIHMPRSTVILFRKVKWWGVREGARLSPCRVSCLVVPGISRAGLCRPCSSVCGPARGGLRRSRPGWRARTSISWNQKKIWEQSNSQSQRALLAMGVREGGETAASDASST